MYYKILYNKVLEELKTKAIKFKVAETTEELQQTGFNMMSKINPLQEKNSLLETLLIKQNHDKN